ncbi:universal stress protein A [Streptomyces griseoflavus]|nr:universal stress protein A [Streptomyces griseoflavus]
MTHQSPRGGPTHLDNTGAAARFHPVGAVLAGDCRAHTTDRGTRSDSLARVTEQQAPRFERGTDGPKVIVAGVDGSDSSLRAAAYASGLARRQGALLAVVYVQRVVAAGVALGAPVADATEEIAEELVTQIREAMERIKGLSDIRWEFHTFRGDPYNGLVKAADDLRADAVVVGASQQAGHRFVGSVAVRLVKAGRWPVTVVP